MSQPLDEDTKNAVRKAISNLDIDNILASKYVLHRVLAQLLLPIKLPLTLL